jgi:hypothetical protein
MVAVPLNAQITPIAAGQTISGRLDTSDGRLTDDSYFDLYEYRGQAGEQIVITMRSGDFDTYLQGGPADGTGLSAEDGDDDGGGGTDSQITTRVGTSGIYRIRANSLDASETGAYTLTIESELGAAQTGPIQPISANQNVSGRLDASDIEFTDGSYFDLYEYRGQPGESIVVTMRSSDFDTYLQGGSPSGMDLIAEDTDDDSGGGTNSMMTGTVGSDGTYRIRANSLGAGQTGAYTLSIQSQNSSTGSDIVTAGQTVAGRLDTSDSQASDESYFDLWYYDGTPGEQLLITLTSSDFDTYLEWGEESGGGYETVDSDDDGGGGTNSQLEVNVDQSGRYAILANSYVGGQTGAYTLTVESLSTSTSFPSLGLGQTIDSRLDGADLRRSDDTYYEVYVHQGQPGQQVLVTMRSGDFDTYLQAGRVLGENFEADASDDDSGGGTDSQVLVAIPGSGTLAILANALTSSGQGAFTLSVEGLGAGGGNPIGGGGGGGNPLGGGGASSSVPSIAAGNALNGTLSSGSPILADSSFYTNYAYAGSPGDRIRITLASPDFDAYLGWGRLNGTSFTGDVYDDDGGGGTNAQLEVTVDGTGVYGILVNTYTSGQSGSYTLTVESLGAASTPVEEQRDGAKWTYRYVEPSSPNFRSLSQRVKQAGALEEIANALQARYQIPRPVAISFDTCDMINAFYNPNTTEITFCYELVELLAQIFVPDGAWTEEQRSDVFGAIQFVMMHEVGHALVDVLDLPITGREEDVADQLAVYSLIRGYEKGAQAAYAGVTALQPASNEFDDTQLADEHSLGPQRLYNVLCWIYGSDPQKYSNILQGGMLPESRAVRCPGEWDRMAKAWQRLLRSD